MWYNRSTLRGNEFNYTGVQLQIHGGSNFVSKKEKEASLLLPPKKERKKKKGYINKRIFGPLLPELQSLDPTSWSKSMCTTTRSPHGSGAGHHGHHPIRPE